MSLCVRFRKIDRLAAAVAASLVVLVGCGIFDTRNAETPGSGGTPWVPPTLPAQVFINLESGLEDLTGANYEKSLADVFTFIPLAADVDKLGPDVFAGWTKTVEVGVTEVILNDSKSVAVEFIRTQIRDEADFADFRVNYQLVVTYTRGETETFKGVAQFDMQRIGGNWQLIRWTDQQGIEGFATWGYLRGVTRNPNP
jgi:hypothetical protein